MKMEMEMLGKRESDAFNKAVLEGAKSCSGVIGSKEWKKTFFAAAAGKLVADLMGGTVAIAAADIQLEIENGSAVFIRDNLSNKAAFQKMLDVSQGVFLLKTLAGIVLHYKPEERSPARYRFNYRK